MLLAGVAVVVAPWTVRNAIALDRFVPVSTGGGQVLFAGTYLPSDGDPEKVGAEVVERHPRALRARCRPAAATGADPAPAGGSSAIRGWKPTRRSARMGREQLWDDISDQPVEYAGFVATKVWRDLGARPARGDASSPAGRCSTGPWSPSAWSGLVVLALQRRWEALLLATIFVAITALSALLVASPRRVLVMMPLVAALAGVGVVAVFDLLATAHPT